MPLARINIVPYNILSKVPGFFIPFDFRLVSYDAYVTTTTTTTTTTVTTSTTTNTVTTTTTTTNNNNNNTSSINKFKLTEPFLTTNQTL